MHGLMQNHPLLISSLIEHAAVAHPHAEIVSRTPGGITRHSYADIARRARQLAGALRALGVAEGTRVGTMAWNGHRHLELLYGISGLGAVAHTINHRLFPEQIEYIINHAEDSCLAFDVSFLPLIERLAPRLQSVRAFIVLAGREEMPRGTALDLVCYEELIGSHDPEFRWPRLDECTASSLCYTSGTTGHPKGVLYSHRSTVLHSMTACMADAMCLSAADSVLLAAPLFHANGWGLPYSAPLSGTSLVLPGPALDGRSVYELMRSEGVTTLAGVPTVLLMLQQYLEAQGLQPSGELELRRVFTGGAAVPRSVVEFYERAFNARILHAWGMTETSPIGTVGGLLRKHQRLPAEERIEVVLKQGRAPYGVELKVAGVDGEMQPRDGRTAGRLFVRGHWVASGYFGAEDGSALDGEGWFDTGDIATIDPDGYLQITDRAKDVIKSGGEWISSLDLENAAMSHPAVLEAAAIGVPHAKWQERPFLLIVRRPDRPIAREELLEYLAGKVAKWWLPDGVAFVPELPHTATGKLQKTVLRERYARGEFRE
jgi:3-(methylthio)propionyl---CoA ligase